MHCDKENCNNGDAHLVAVGEGGKLNERRWTDPEMRQIYLGRYDVLLIESVICHCEFV
jgi:hypothetical protein